MVLVNSGKFDYAEVDLSVPMHLVGQNNAGKTTLISTLQFLFIDKKNQMHFSRNMDETRRYYFPGSDSYVLFECLTPTGYMVMGTRGLGPLKGYDFCRFIYRGEYFRSDYINENGSIRNYSDIVKSFALRGYTELNSSQLQSALTGIGSVGMPVLGLVPVKNRDGYSKFKTIFRNLLRLSHLSQQELKGFLVDVNRSELRLTEIDLAGDYSVQYQAVEKRVHELVLRLIYFI